jgi:hypothetical protein
MSRILPRGGRPLIVCVLMGGAALSSLALFLAFVRGEPRARAHLAAPTVAESEPASATTSVTVEAAFAPAPTWPLNAPAAEAAPRVASEVQVCEGVRLVEVATQAGSTAVWLGDAHGIEQLEPGQRFRDYVLLDAKPASEHSAASALLRGPKGNCRTASKQESLATLVAHLNQASRAANPAAPTTAAATDLSPALATQLAAVLQRRAPQKAAAPGG